MNLFVVHCGFYDALLSEGGAPNIYEGHHNFYVVAKDASNAKTKVKERPIYKQKKMHVDGIHQLSVVDGFKVELVPTKSAETGIQGYNYNDSKKL